MATPLGKTNPSVLIPLLLFLGTASPLFGEEDFSLLLSRWFALESALVTESDTEREGLLSALEAFETELDNFTSSLLFAQYEATGLLRAGNGEKARHLTEKLSASLKAALAAETLGDARASAQAKNAARQNAVALQAELVSWTRLDSWVSSRMFSRFAYILTVLLGCIAALVVLASLLYRALTHSRIQEQDSADFSRSAMLERERERARISRELHDTVLQDLGRLLRQSEVENIASISALALRVMKRAREICQTLMPPDFSRLALEDSLRQLCADFEIRTSVECRAIISENFSVDSLDPEKQLHVYRIIQEALSNIEKHAGAKEATVTVRNTGSGGMLVCVSDDGPAVHGDRPELLSGKGLGIRGMYQRAAILGGDLSFVSGAGQGLTVRLEIPGIVKK